MPFPQPDCRDDARRALLDTGAAATGPNGIDYLEVRPGQVELWVTFFHNLVPPLDATRVRVEGGVRERNLRVTGVSALAPNRVAVTVDRPGDYSTYALVVDDPARFDPYYARVEFSFKVDCPGRFDCRPRAGCAPPADPVPPFDYLARDYASFRRAMLDLLAARVPGWRERHEADLGVTLVELLAYVGDQLSYFQDAVATEAYLETARQRVSVRRHARLIDYPMHDGASARALVYCAAAPGQAGTVPKGTRFLTRIPGPPALARGAVSRAVGEAALGAATAFEALADTAIDHRLNRIRFHTWGNAHCCLAAGATQADLVDADGTLAAVVKRGTLLVFEEVRGPATGAEVDADRTRRQVVRVTDIDPSVVTDPVLGVLVLRVLWGAADALRFGFCISGVKADGAPVADVSVARGNLVLADQGRRAAEWFPGDPAAAGARGVRVGPRPFRFALKEAPLAFRYPDPDPGAPAADLFAADPHTARAWLAVESGAGEPWAALSDLLASRPLDPHLAVETDNDGRAVLRCGDNVNGRAPADGEFFRLMYRVGRGAGGNVAADALWHAIDDGALAGLVAEVRNPLPAWGGADPEPVERVKRLAPDAFRAGLHRAVTEADYARAAELLPEVSHAAARFRWTGSWRTVFLLIDPKGRADLPPDLRERVRRHVAAFALAGHDLEVRPAAYAPLGVEIEVCAAPGHFPGDVERAVRDALTGPGGFFDPDRFTFGDAVYLSALVAAVVAVPGVSSARVTRFRRTNEFDGPPGRPATAANLASGRIAVGRFEVARLDNDPNFPENGTLALTVLGGP